jgi:hypothetical protein
MNQKWNLLTVASTLSLCVLFSGNASAQIIGGGVFTRAVGGVSIDTDGVVRNILERDSEKLASELRRDLQGASDELKGATKARHVSLKNLTKALKEADQNHSNVSEDIAMMGGLTRIEYVLIYPEQNDIVLVGPAEEWRVANDGTVVGTKSGQPILNVEDFIVAFSKVNTANPEVISCSIEPTKEGSDRLQQLLDKVNLQAGQSPTAYEPAMRDAFGPQQVLINGVNADSHLARVIFAADYQMKRIGMKLKESPVEGLPSYVDMLRHAKPPKNQSRWWMACNYDAVQKSDDSLVWKIQGPGLKVLTEEEVVQSDGSRLGTGDKQEIAAKWADTFTSKIDDLSVSEPAIGQLRGVMDLCVAAAIIRTHGLEDLAQCDLSAIRSIRLDHGNDEIAPKSVDPQCSFVRAGSNWIVTTSGGVLVDPWATAKDVKVSSELGSVRKGIEPASNKWTWN